MATQIMNRMEEETGVDKETLYMFGGVALVVLRRGTGAIQFHRAPLSQADRFGRFGLGCFARHRAVLSSACDVAHSKSQESPQWTEI